MRLPCLLRVCSDVPVLRGISRPQTVLRLGGLRISCQRASVKMLVDCVNRTPEQRTLNPRVRGSSPWRRTRTDLGFCRSRSFLMCPVCPHVGSMFARGSRPGRGGLVQSGRIRAGAGPAAPDMGRPMVYTSAGRAARRLPGTATQRETCRWRRVARAPYRPAGRSQPEVPRMRGRQHRRSSITSAGGPLRLQRRVPLGPPGRRRMLGATAPSPSQCRVYPRTTGSALEVREGRHTRADGQERATMPTRP
jgi:hypothetical protein